MLSLRKPSTETIRAFLALQSKEAFSYSAVGATATVPPSDYTVDHTRLKLGEGERVFAAAKSALERWEQFRLGWVEARSPDASITAGMPMAVVARSLGLWWLNASRVVYVVDDQGPVRRFGFAHGTLPDHIAMGEERFLIEWDQGDRCVWYDILAFSRPSHLPARLGYPWLRKVQKRFGRESAAAMMKAVGETAV